MLLGRVCVHGWSDLVLGRRSVPKIWRVVDVRADEGSCGGLLSGTSLSLSTHVGEDDSSQTTLHESRAPGDHISTSPTGRSLTLKLEEVR